MADPRLAWALATVIVRYLTTIQPHAHRELARWRRRALAIPDPELRTHILRPFDADMSAMGASIFAVLAPWRQQPTLVRLLVAYVLLWSYVDVRTERDPNADRRLYGALIAALPGECANSTAWTPGDDAGYLAALLDRCRRDCRALPSWAVVAAPARRLAEDGRIVQEINHGPPSDAEARLRGWGKQRTAGAWHEACAAASSPLAIHALMALGTHCSVETVNIGATVVAYSNVSALGVLCDHLIDQAEDHVLVNHSYLSYLGSPTARRLVLRDLAERAVHGLEPLPGSMRHSVILAAMTAMFCSRPRATTSALHATSEAVLRAVGPPAPQLAAALRARQQLARRLAT